MKCNFGSKKAKRASVSEFLRKYGDDLPEAAIKKATSAKLIDNFGIICDDDNEIIALETYEQNDWYLCTLRYAATRPDRRRKGLGTEVTGEVLEKTKKDPGCLVLAADITYDNEASKRMVKKFGFEEVTRFCWGEGEKPADIVHLVRFPAKNNGDSCEIS